MGGSQSSTELSQCLLSQKDFQNLRAGMKIDHRNNEGRFCPAVIKAKHGNTVKLSYYESNSAFDTEVNYNNQTAMDFAKFKSVSFRLAKGPLAEYTIGDYILFDVNGDWKHGKIIKMDKKDGRFRSGQVQVQCGNIKRWTHLDNEIEIQSFEQHHNNTKNTQQSQQSYGNRSNRFNAGRNNNNNFCGNNNNNNNVGGYKTQQQSQIKRQDQMTIRTQLLLDDTRKQIKLTRDYLDAVRNHKKYTKDDISIYNQKVVTGLMCFKMKINGMRKNAQKENINFNNAFKSSAQIIREFEIEYTTQFGNNKFLMQRLNPCLNYMRAILQGKKNIPALPYVDDYEFNKETASSVMSQITHAQNHVIPDRMKEVNDNNEHYKKQQKKLKDKYEQSDHKENVQDVNINGLIQDFGTNNIAFGLSKKEQDKIIQKQQNEFKFKRPDLLNGAGNDSDIGNSNDDDDDEDEDNDHCMMDLENGNDER